MNGTKCPHCNLQTKCNCGTCGVKYRKADGSEGFEQGICKVCNGKGKI